MTVDEREEIGKEIYSEVIFILTNILFEKIGNEEAMKSIRPYVRMSGRAFAINMQKRFDIEGTDLEKITDLTQLLEMFSGTPYLQTNWGTHDVHVSKEKIVRAGYLNCSNIRGSKDFCKYAHEMMLNSICEAVNPEYECRFTQMITAGDPLCSYVIEKKATGKGPDRIRD